MEIGTRIPPQLRRQGMEAVAQFARKTGLTALDLPAVDEEAAAICREYNLRIGTVDASGVGKLLNPNRATRDSAVASVRAQIDAMKRHGAETVFMCLVPEDPAQPVRESLGYFAETFVEVAKACEDAGVRIALEGWPGPAPHYATLGYTPEVWRAMFEAVPSSALGLCFDPSHLVRLGIDYLRVLAEFSSRIHHCHGKDTQILHEAQYRYGHHAAQLTKAPDFSEGPWRYCIPGEGEVAWERVAFALATAGYAGCVSIELEDARYWGSVEREQVGIQKAYRHLSQWIMA